MTTPAADTRINGTPARANWRDDRRQDRLVAAQIERDRDAAQRQAKTAERDAAARRRRENADARREAAAQARAERDKRRTARAGWIAAHVTDLLFVPVIGVPGVLAWTAMAAYGASLYGPAGWALPLFSEGAMWAFEAAVTMTRHKDAKRLEDDPVAEPSPVWHLRLGVAVFAVFGAVLNFAHGMSPALAHHGPLTGTVMALISIAGVTAHHLTKAGPRPARRTRAERDADRIARAIDRREFKARKEAVKDARAQVGTDGTARLVFTPTVTAEPDSTPSVAEDTGPATEAATTPDTPADSAPPAAPTPKRTPRPRPKRTAKPDNAARVARLRARHPDLTAPEIADRLGISARTVRRYPASQPAQTAQDQ